MEDIMWFITFGIIFVLLATWLVNDDEDWWE